MESGNVEEGGDCEQGRRMRKTESRVGQFLGGAPVWGAPVLG